MTLLEIGLRRKERIRLVRQTEVAECGLASLAMIANYHGHDVSLGALRRRFQPSPRGATLKSLMAMADRLGLTPRAVRVPLERLQNLHLPAILHWNMVHYVVLERIAGGKAFIHDPEGSSRWLPLSKVSLHFTGVALELRPANDFVIADQPERLSLRQLWSRMTGFKRALVQAVVLSLVLEAFALTSPYYMQIAVDSALPALDRNLLLVLALGFGLFTLVNAGTSLLRSLVLLFAGTAMGYGIAINVARHLFRLPVAWFEKRHVGDVLSRFQSVAPIQQFLTQGAVSALLDGVLAICTLGLMYCYSVALSSVALIAFVAYASVRAISFSEQRTAQEEVIVAAGREQSAIIESLRGIVTLRLFNAEMSRHALWQSRLTDLTNAGIGVARIAAWQNAASTLILGLETVVAIWLAVGLVIDGGFSLGMVFAYLAYKTQFLQRTASLMEQLIAFRMLGLHLERLSDIALTEPDNSFADCDPPGQPSVECLELSALRFRYSPTDPLIFDDVDLRVERGEHIAITGPSGGGKSTFLKVLLGLIEPEAGEVLIDGVPLARYGYQAYHAQIGAVLQDDALFAGSLSDNIALFDDEPDQERIWACAEAAALHDDIAAMPMGYDTLVGDMGSILSGGQKQRLLLARALYRQPKILVLDEGTSHLDPARERVVNAAIAKMGITRIVVAHRLESILSAQRVYLMEGGALREVTSQYDAMRKVP